MNQMQGKLPPLGLVPPSLLPLPLPSVLRGVHHSPNFEADHVTSSTRESNLTGYQILEVVTLRIPLMASTDSFFAIAGHRYPPKTSEATLTEQDCCPMQFCRKALVIIRA
ncbi:hypothetical protein Vadar_001707 [Vaccinium darrowii]|uniref:Uncharacterized protein n=1 Tax=Vaccinium darrowii TaxID=229202 RepID=A0ACB7XXA4_9ERIC|nr:hypothetical protein Vadar_001707 [Vaccinium darrowii]